MKDITENAERDLKIILTGIFIALFSPAIILLVDLYLGIGVLATGIFITLWFTFTTLKEEPIGDNVT